MRYRYEDLINHADKLPVGFFTGAHPMMSFDDEVKKWLPYDAMADQSPDLPKVRSAPSQPVTRAQRMFTSLFGKPYG